MSQYTPLADKQEPHSYLAPEHSNSLHDNCILIDTAGTILSAKGNAKKVLGLTGQQLSGTQFLDLIHQDDRAKASASLQAVALGAVSVTLQCRFISADQSCIDLVWSAIFNEASKTLCCFFAHAMQEMNTAQLQSIYKAYKLSQVGWWEWDALTNKLSVSDELFAIYGLDKALHLPFSIEDFLLLVHPADVELVKAAIAKNSQSNYNEYTHRLVQPSGNIIHVMQQVQTEVDEHGNIVQMHGTVKDITTQKKTEQALEEAEQKWRNILDSIADGFFSIDTDRNILYFNKAAERYSGKTKAEVLGKNFWEQFPRARKTFVYKKYETAIKENKPVYFEIYSEFANSWFDVGAYPSCQGLSVFFRSVNERKKQEEATRISNERYQLISKASSDAIWDWDLVADTINWGEGIETIFGHKLVNGRDSPSAWANFIHPDDVARVTCSINKVIKGKESFWRDEYRYRKSDLSYAIVSDRGYVIRDAEGKGIRMVGAMQDITAQKEAELSIRLSEERFKLLFDQSPKPKWMFNEKTLRIVEVNEAAIKLYGYTKEEFLQLTIPDLKLKEDLPELEQLMETMLNSYHGIVRHVKKSGEHFYLQVHTQLINLPGGRHFIVAGDDQTEKLELQHRLIRDQVAAQRRIAQAVLNTQERERSEIGRELHDNVNQLLATTKLYIESIQYYPDQQADFIQKGISLLQKSIEEIRALSRQLVTPDMNDIGFVATIDELIGHFRSLHTFDIDVRYKLSENNLEKELKHTIYRIIQEQLTNIVKHAAASKVNIAIIQSTGQLKLTVQDNGVGFSRDKGSKGIGLKNIKNRAEIYNGSVNIITAINAGCTIEVNFPI
jgi:PAS domain S-box-containing protein